MPRCFPRLFWRFISEIRSIWYIKRCHGVCNLCILMNIDFRGVYHACANSGPDARPRLAPTHSTTLVQTLATMPAATLIATYAKTACPDAHPDARRDARPDARPDSHPDAGCMTHATRSPRYYNNDTRVVLKHHRDSESERIPI